MKMGRGCEFVSDSLTAGRAQATHRSVAENGFDLFDVDEADFFTEVGAGTAGFTTGGRPVEEAARLVAALFMARLIAATAAVLAADVSFCTVARRLEAGAAVVQVWVFGNRC